MRTFPGRNPTCWNAPRQQGGAFDGAARKVIQTPLQTDSHPGGAKTRGCRADRPGAPLKGVLAMDQVHVVRHKVLVEGVSVRRVAREMGISRNTVRRYLDQGEPSYGPREAQPPPVMDRVRAAHRSAAGRVTTVDGWQAATDGDATSPHACRRGLLRRRDPGQGGRGGVETAPPRSLRAARVSPGRSSCCLTSRNRQGVLGPIKGTLARSAAAPALTSLGLARSSWRVSVSLRLVRAKPPAGRALLTRRARSGDFQPPTPPRFTE